MTREHRIVFALSDLTAIQLRCSKCRAEVAQAPAAATLPLQCPVCSASWLRLPAGADQTAGVIEAIRAALQPTAHEPLVDLRFALDADGGADGR